MLRAFMAYGLLGWCAEVLWTALYDVVSGTRRAEGDRVARVPSTGRSPVWFGFGMVLERVHDYVSALPL